MVAEITKVKWIAASDLIIINMYIENNELNVKIDRFFPSTVYCIILKLYIST